MHRKQNIEKSLWLFELRIAPSISTPPSPFIQKYNINHHQYNWSMLKDNNASKTASDLQNDICTYKW